MALIDVSDLLTDPDFTDSVTLIRRASSINVYGEHVMAETSTTITAVVQGTNTEDLIRMPEAARLRDMITVYYKGELMAMSVNGYADVIVWQDNRYQVATIDENFPNFGAGFTRAICNKEAVSA